MSTRIAEAAILVLAASAVVWAAPEETGRADERSVTVTVTRPENTGFLNLIPTTVSIGRAHHIRLAGGHTRSVAVAPGRYSVFVKSPGMGAGDSDWRSEPVLITVVPSTGVCLEITPAERSSGYAGRWQVRVESQRNARCGSVSTP